MRFPITRVTVKSKDLPATLFHTPNYSDKVEPVSSLCQFQRHHMQFVRETPHVYVQVVTVTAFVRRNPSSHGRFLISSPTATPTPLRLSPRQTSQPTFHFVPPKTFSQNKAHQMHHFVPLNRFIWDKTSVSVWPRNY